MTIALYVLIGLVAFVALTSARFLVLAIPAWVVARREGDDPSLVFLAGLAMRRNSPLRLVRSRARLREAGLAVDLGELAAMAESGVDPRAMARTVESRAARGMESDLYALSAVALEGELDSHGLASDPVRSMIAARSRTP